MVYLLNTSKRMILWKTCYLRTIFLYSCFYIVTNLLKINKMKTMERKSGYRMKVENSFLMMLLFHAGCDM